jgi:hypothetical protein
MTDKITCGTINTQHGFRNAFQAIARRAVPHMDKGGYYGDLLYDAASADRLRPGEGFYLLVRDYGTNYFEYLEDALAHLQERGDGKAVLRVERREWNEFDVSHVHGTQHIAFADEFFDTYFKNGTYDRERGSKALEDLRVADKAAFYKLMTSKEFVSKCLDNAHLFGFSDTLSSDDDLSDETWDTIDALNAEADDLEERAMHLRAQVDALRDH